jgi:hypothetical protein
MTTTQAWHRELDLLDWDAPTGFPSEDQCASSSADQDPELYEFIRRMAEIVHDQEEWNRFTAAFKQYDRSRGRH